VSGRPGLQPAPPAASRSAASEIGFRWAVRKG
jgi:hypothetical protein